MAVTSSRREGDDEVEVWSGVWGSPGVEQAERA